MIHSCATCEFQRKAILPYCSEKVCARNFVYHFDENGKISVTDPEENWSIGSSGHPACYYRNKTASCPDWFPRTWKRPFPLSLLLRNKGSFSVVSLPTILIIDPKKVDILLRKELEG